MSKVHRGRTKKNAKALTLYLIPEEWEVLKELATDQLRSASAQAAWIIRQALLESVVAAIVDNARPELGEKQ